MQVRSAFQLRLIELLESRVLLSAGDLDPTFGTGGQAITRFEQASATAYCYALSVAVQSDGKAVSTGICANMRPGRDVHYDFPLARYNVDGSPDASFGTDGVLTTDFFGSDDNAFKVLIQPDGKILVAGSTYNPSLSVFEFAVARYNYDGTLDQTFGVAGKATAHYGNNAANTAFSMALDAHGNIILAGITSTEQIGSSDFAVVKFDQHGTLDTSFGTGGIAVTDFAGRNDIAKSVVIDNDGNIIVGGYSDHVSDLIFALARYDANGRLDASFGSGGLVTNPGTGADVIENIALVPNGYLIAQGEGNLVEYDSSGTLDSAFGTNGVASLTTGHGGARYGLFVAPDGKLVVGGTTASITGQSFAWIISRYTPNGSLDNSFGNAGEVITQFTGYDDCDAVTMTADGNIVAVGLAGNDNATNDHFAIARYLGDTPAIANTSLSLPPVTGVYNGNVALTGTLTSGQVAIANALVTFRIKGASVGSAVTDSSGVATLAGVSLGGINPGSYANAITADYAGDAGHRPSTAASSLDVIDENLQGLVWVDFNDDGIVDFGEQGVDGVSVTLSGTDDLQHSVNLSAVTSDGGIYTFNHIRPGNYTISEGPLPSGFVDGKDVVGTLGGNATVNNLFSNVLVGRNQNGYNYNFGEHPAPGSAEAPGQASGSGFWANKKGQVLIASFGGTDGSGRPNLSTWLALTLPHIFGVDAGNNDLTGMTPAQVAQAYQSKFVLHDKLDAQVMATALNVYASNAALGGPQASAYGFTISQYGLGNATFNIGADGGAFVTPNGTTLTIMEILESTDRQSVGGNLYNGDTVSRRLAKDAYGAINAGGQ